MGLSGEIRDAVEAHLAGTSGLPSSAQWSVQNTAFQPTLGTTWVRLTFAPGFRDLLTVPASGGWVQTSGLVFVDLFFPLDRGPDTADDLSDAVVARFPPGQQFTLAGGRTLRVTRSLARGGNREKEWYHVPVEIGWEIETVNALI